MQVNVSIESLIEIKRNFGVKSVQFLGESVKKRLWNLKTQNARKIDELKELVAFQDKHPARGLVLTALAEREIKRLSNLDCDLNELLSCFEEKVNFDAVLAQFKRMKEKDAA